MTQSQPIFQNFINDPNSIPTSTTTVPTWLSQLPLIGGLFSGLNAANKDKQNEAVYSSVLSNFLQVDVNADSKVNGYQPTINIFTTLFQRLTTAMNNVYAPINMTQVISPALVTRDQTEWANMPTYASAIQANTNEIATTIGVIDQLTRLGEEIKQLHIDYPPTKPSASYSVSARLAPGATTLQGSSTQATLSQQGEVIPSTFEEYQAELKIIEDPSYTTPLTDFQRELKRIADTFNFIAPNLVSKDDIAAELATENNISNKLDSIAGKNGDIAECIKEVSKAPKGSEVGRRPLPADLQPYITDSDVANLPTTSSFLPDFYYGEGQQADQLSAFQSIYGFAEDPNKTIQNDDVVTINNQPMPNALGGLESLIGIY
jgi:hypothetical protein